ncbi:MAG: hypothetical protein K9W43_11180 [Candidatus Thorarchaeota archaeon]|nr:hypothetical protein [Candidatus Thorarchaeota archaeon]
MITVSGGHYYDVDIDVAHQDYDSVSASAIVSLQLNGTVLFTRSIHSSETSDSDNNELVTAYASMTYRFYATGDTVLRINGTIIEGDSCALRIFQDIPQSLNAGILESGTLTFVMALVTFLLIFGYMWVSSKQNSNKPLNESKEELGTSK